LEKQGNYFFKLITLPPGEVHTFKYVVDDVWQYDLGQPHEDDGSGNWNNYIEIGTADGKKPHILPAKKEQPVRKEQPPKQQKQQQPKKEQQQQPKKEQQQQPKKGKQQQQAKIATPEPKQEATPEPKREPTPEPVPEPEPEQAPPPPTVLFSTVQLAIVPNGENENLTMKELEDYVRSITVPGLTWQASSVEDCGFFGMKKLCILCRCKDDVSVEDVCITISQNEEIVGSATIEQFSCV